MRTLKHPLSVPYVAKKQTEFVNDCIERNWISSGGKYTELLEKEFSNFCEVSYASTCSNGTTALHLALLASGAGPTKEVILPCLNSQYALFAVYHSRATPRLMDVQEDWSLDPKLFESLINQNTVAVIIPHLFGRPNDFQSILEIAERNNIKIIEDCAEAHGAKLRGRPVGAIGYIGCFSFYANKILSSGEGGICVTNSKEALDKINYFKNQTFDGAQQKTLKHQHIGYNYRLGDISAAIAYAQLLEIDDILHKRKLVESRYRENLGDRFDFPIDMATHDPVNWMTLVGFKYNEKNQRDLLCDLLFQYGVPTRPFFPSLDTQPCLNAFENLAPVIAPISRHIAGRHFYLPTYTQLDQDEIDIISSKVLKAYEELN